MTELQEILYVAAIFVIIGASDSITALLAGHLL